MVIRSAISPRRAAYRAENASTTAIRSAGDIRGHGPSSKACRAAATAASMSAAVPSGTVATSSSLCGEITCSRSPEAGADHSPPMKSASRSRFMVAFLCRQGARSK